MTEAREMRDHGLGCALIVDLHRKVGGDVRPTIDEDEREALTAQRGDGRVGHATGRDEESVGLMLAEQAKRGGLALRRVIGVAQHQLVAVLARGFLRAADDRRKEGIGDVRDEHAEGLRALKPQPASDGRRSIFEALHRGQNPAARLGAQRQIGPMQRARNRRRMHPSESRDIQDRASCGRIRILPTENVCGRRLGG